MDIIMEQRKLNRAIRDRDFESIDFWFRRLRSKLKRLRTPDLLEMLEYLQERTETNWRVELYTDGIEPSWTFYCPDENSKFYGEEIMANTLKHLDEHLTETRGRL